MIRLLILIYAIGLFQTSMMAQISRHSFQIRNPDPNSGFGVYVDERLVPKGTIVDQGCIQFSKGPFPGAPPDKSVSPNEFFASPCGGVFFEAFLVEKGDYFTIDTIDAGQFERMKQKQTLPERFVLAFTGPIYAIAEDTRDHFGWVEIVLEDGQPTIVDQAMAYQSPGIVIGSTATELEPEVIELSIRRAVGVQFQTTEGKTYQMFASPDGMNWREEGEPFPGTGESIEQFFPANKIATFYRLEEVP